MRRFVAYGPAFVVLLTVVVVLFAGPAAVRRIGSARTEARIILARGTLDDDDVLDRINRAIRAVAESVRPSVVHLDVTPPEGRRMGGGVHATGSGWVYDGAGHIITNAHVVRGARSISVQFADGRIAEAEQVNGSPFIADPYTDIAVLKVPEDPNLFPVRRASGVQPQQGDKVFVFGSPFGFKFSMSQGIVSGLGRDAASASEFGGFTNYIQTDAAVNPGNSGGPLVDMNGAVVGINTLIAAPQGRPAQGLGFAVPIDTARRIAPQLAQDGKVTRSGQPYLGVSLAELGARGGIQSGRRQARPQGVEYGVVAAQVEPSGPAGKAGLQADDIITAIDDRDVSTSDELLQRLVMHQSGDQTTLTVMRGGLARKITVTIGEAPAR
jgi:S1-C subfamily serine protease